MCPGAVMNVLVRLGTNQGRDWGYMNLLVRTATDFKTVAFVLSAIPPWRRPDCHSGPIGYIAPSTTPVSNWATAQAGVDIHTGYPERYTRPDVKKPARLPRSGVARGLPHARFSLTLKLATARIKLDPLAN